MAASLPIKDKTILIAGPGALGCFLAARLGQRFARLYVFDYKESRALEFEEKGIHITGKTVIDWMPPQGRLGAGSRAWPKMDVVFFCVKARDLAKAFVSVRKWTTPKTRLVSLAQGAAADAVMKKKSRRQWVRAVYKQVIAIDRPGRAVHVASGLTFVDKAAAGAADVVNILHEASIAARLEPQFDRALWMQALTDACVGPLSGVSDVTYGRLAEPQLQSIVDRFVDEATTISKAAQKPLSRAELHANISELITHAADAASSFRRDLSSGRPTERKDLLEPLVALAARKRVAAPLLTFFNGLIARLEKEQQKAAR
jgi:2-dehydropantoate 2-reductase